jgi:hypothetical protein
MTETPTPDTAGDARELSDEQLLRAFADEVEYCVLDNRPAITAIESTVQTEIRQRLRRVTPAAEPGMVTISKRIADDALLAVSRWRDERAADPKHWEYWGWVKDDLVAAIAGADPAPGAGEWT